MAKPKSDPLNEYLAMIPADRYLVIQAIDAQIRRAVPQLAPCLTAGLLGYGPYQYQYSSGHEGGFDGDGAGGGSGGIMRCMCVRWMRMGMWPSSIRRELARDAPHHQDADSIPRH